MKAAILILSITVLSPDLTLAQVPVGVDDRRPPSPEAAALGSFGDVPLSLFRGTATIEVPLVSVQGATLQLPVALRYSSGGIRLADVPGWVGAGWTLEAGGVITRVVRALPDESTFGYLNTGWAITDEVWEQARERIYTSDQFQTPIKNYLDLVRLRRVDPEPDAFYFNFGGYSGRFFLDRHGVAHTVPRTSLKIEYAGLGEIEEPVAMNNLIEVPRGIHRWIITTPDGNKFYFGNFEQNEAAVEYSVIDWNRTSAGATLCEDGQCVWISAWSLVKVETPFGETIRLEYQRTPDREIPQHRQETNYLYRIGQEEFCGAAGSQLDSPEWSETTPRVRGSRLRSISSDYQSIDFHASLRGSDYMMPAEYRLDSISVRHRQPNGSLVHGRTAHFRYLQGSDASTVGSRLFLESVAVRGIGGTVDPPYRFEYAQAPSILPSDGLSKAIDHWGYFNGAPNTTLLPQVVLSIPFNNPYLPRLFTGANRDPVLEYAVGGALSRIYYPTGGWTELQYELHDYALVGTEGGGRNAEVRTSLTHVDELYVQGLPETREATFVLGSESQVLITGNVSFGMFYIENPGDDGGSVEPHSVPDCDGPCATVIIKNQHGSTVYALGSNVLNSSQLAVEDHRALLLPAGSYTATATNLYSPTDLEQFGASVSVSELRVEPGNVAHGGLRVRRVAHFDGTSPSGEPTTETRYRYLSPIPGRPDRSSGVVEEEFRLAYEGQLPDGLCYWAYRQSTPIYALGSGGEAVMYASVEVVQGSGNHGRSVHAFDVHDPQSSGMAFIPYESNNVQPLTPLGSRTRYDYRYGQEIAVTVYDDEGRIVHRTTRRPGGDGLEQAAHARAIAARVSVVKLQSPFNLASLREAPYYHYQRYAELSEWRYFESERVAQFSRD